MVLIENDMDGVNWVAATSFRPLAGIMVLIMH